MGYTVNARLLAPTRNFDLFSPNRSNFPGVVWIDSTITVPDALTWSIVTANNMSGFFSDYSGRGNFDLITDLAWIEYLPVGCYVACFTDEGNSGTVIFIDRRWYSYAYCVIEGRYPEYPDEDEPIRSLAGILIDYYIADMAHITVQA